MFHTQGHGAPPSATHGVENRAKGMWTCGVSPQVPQQWNCHFFCLLWRWKGQKNQPTGFCPKFRPAAHEYCPSASFFTVFTPTKHTPGPPAPKLICQWHEYLGFLWNRPQILLFHLGSETLKSWVYQWELIAEASSPPAAGGWNCPALAAGSQTCSHIKGLWKLQVLNWKGHKDLQACFACN